MLSNLAEAGSRFKRALNEGSEVQVRALQEHHWLKPPPALQACYFRFSR